MAGRMWAAAARFLAQRFSVRALSASTAGSGSRSTTGWIHLQFARNLAAGEGLAYNPGELVAGSTAPLWTALRRVRFLLPHLPVGWTKRVLGIAFHLLGVVATWRLARELGLSAGARRRRRGPRGDHRSRWCGRRSRGWRCRCSRRSACGGWRCTCASGARRERPPLSLAVLALAVLARPEGCCWSCSPPATGCCGCSATAASCESGRPPGGAAVGLGPSPRWPCCRCSSSTRWLAGSPLPTTFDTKAGYSSPGHAAAALPARGGRHAGGGAAVATLLAPAGSWPCWRASAATATAVCCRRRGRSACRSRTACCRGAARHLRQLRPLLLPAVAGGGGAGDGRHRRPGRRAATAPAGGSLATGVDVRRSAHCCCCRVSAALGRWPTATCRTCATSRPATCVWRPSWRCAPATGGDPRGRRHRRAQVPAPQPRPRPRGHRLAAGARLRAALVRRHRFVLPGRARFRPRRAPRLPGDLSAPPRLLQRRRVPAAVAAAGARQHHPRRGHDRVPRHPLDPLSAATGAAGRTRCPDPVARHSHSWRPPVAYSPLRAQARRRRDPPAVARALERHARPHRLRPRRRGGGVRDAPSPTTSAAPAASASPTAPTRWSLALRALDLQPGDEVLVPAFSFFATAEAVVLRRRHAGLRRRRPRDPQPRPRRRRGPRHRRAPSASSASTSTAGRSTSTPIAGALRAARLWLIEDAAQAHGARWRGRRVRHLRRARGLELLPDQEPRLLRRRRRGDSAPDAELLARVRAPRQPRPDRALPPRRDRHQQPARQPAGGGAQLPAAAARRRTTRAGASSPPLPRAASPASATCASPTVRRRRRRLPPDHRAHGAARRAAGST